MELTQEYQDKAQALGLKLYVPSMEADYFLMKLWLNLVETGDIKKIVLPESRALSAFIQIYQPPTITVYTINPSNNIDFIFWATPASSHENEQTCLLGVWADSQMRGSLKLIRSLGLIYDFLFSTFNFCLITTWQLSLLKTFQKAGYVVVGCIPKIYGLDLIYLLSLEKSKYYGSKFYNIYQRGES